MEKIMELLKTIGASEELAGKLCEELDRFDKTVHDKNEGGFKEKLDKAKKICLEEVEKYKQELARKVGIYMESKSSEIEKSIDQRRAIEESEASSKLRRVREVTEDIEVADDAGVQALKEQIKKLTGRNRTLTEGKIRAEEAANRANAIAMDLIREQKKAEGDVVQEEVNEDGVTSEGGEESISEENREKNREVIKEAIKARRRLRKPRTTRKTLTESQDLTRSETQSEGIEVSEAITNIADNMPDYV